MARAARLDDPLAQEALEQLLIHLDGIERQLDTLDARLAEIAGSERWGGQVKLLTRFRGIAAITALGLIAETAEYWTTYVGGKADHHRSSEG